MTARYKLNSEAQRARLSEAQMPLAINWVPIDL